MNSYDLRECDALWETCERQGRTAIATLTTAALSVSFQSPLAVVAWQCSSALVSASATHTNTQRNYVSTDTTPRDQVHMGHYVCCLRSPISHMGYLAGLTNGWRHTVFRKLQKTLRCLFAVCYPLWICVGSNASIRFPNCVCCAYHISTSAYIGAYR